MKLFKFFLDLIAPKKCYSCKKEWHFICPDCFDKEINFASICYVCKWTTKNYEVHESCKNWIYYDKVIILKHYKSKLISKLIKDAKFYNKKEILEEISFYLYDKFLLYVKIIKTGDFLITSVPSHFLRKFVRWYNSSDILAKNLSKISQIQYKNNILSKIKLTKQQSKLDRKNRINNLKDSFRINQSVKNKILIVIDDVISTWTTLNEVSKLLKQNWAKTVIWLIIASD